MMSITAILLVAFVSCALAAGQPSDPDFAVLEKLDAASTLVTVKSPTATLSSVLDLLSTAGGFEVEIRWSPSPGAAPEAALAKQSFPVDWDKISMKDALTRLAKQFSLRYEVPNGMKLVVLTEK
jgi:hypothetical protein